MHFDLDPVSGATFEQVLETALRVRQALEALHIPCYPKTTGSRGMHVYVPIERGPVQKHRTLCRRHRNHQMVLMLAARMRRPRLITRTPK